MANMLQGKPLHVRRRIAVIATGSIGIILVLALIYIYTHPQPVQRDPERAITAAYTTILGKVQSLFHHK